MQVKHLSGQLGQLEGSANLHTFKSKRFYLVINLGGLLGSSPQKLFWFISF